jgi:hypothetical protein
MVSKDIKPAEGPDCICHIPCPLMVKQGVSPIAKLIFGIVYGNFDREGKPIVLTNERIGHILGISPRTVRAEISNLADKEMLIVEQGRKRKLKPNMDYEWDYAEWDRVSKIFTGEIPFPEDEDNTLYALKGVSKDIMEIITYWNTKIELTPVKIPNKLGDKFEMTPTFTNIVKVVQQLFEGKLFNSYKSYRFYHDKPWTVAEVKESIDHFHLAATCDDYYPTAKESCRKKTLGTFIFNPYIKDPKWKSSLIMYVDPPKPFYYRVKAEEAQSLPLYHSLRQEYVSIYPQRGMNPPDDMKLVVASNRLNEWINQHKKYLPSMPMASMWASYTLQALIELIQVRGKAQYDVLDTVRKEWFWDYFTQFMQKKGLLSTYSIK